MNYTSSISPGIISVNVIYSILIVKGSTMMVIKIFRFSNYMNYTSSISPGIISVNVIYSILIVKGSISDSVGEIICSWWNLFFSYILSGKSFMMSFSFKIELRWINSSPFLPKEIGMIYFAGFFIFYDFLYTFVKRISAMRSSHLFWKLL